MPPRYVYWTILIDGKATAFRAREREELLPTFNQLRRTNKDVAFKWFARGRIWNSREEAQADPRARFKKHGRPDARPRRDNDRPPREHGKPKPDVVEAFKPAHTPARS